MKSDGGGADLHFPEDGEIIGGDAQGFEGGLLGGETFGVTPGGTSDGIAGADLFGAEDTVALPPLTARQFLLDAAVSQQIDPDTHDHYITSVSLPQRRRENRDAGHRRA